MSTPAEQVEPLRLNLGGGGKHVEGFVGVDISDRYGPVDVHADIRALPYEDGTVDEIMAIHVIEHFYLWEIADVLREWLRVLRPGGQCAIECPDLDRIIRLLNAGEMDPYLTLFGLYGDQPRRDPLMQHKWAYTPATLEHLLLDVGFSEVAHEPPLYHRPERDLRVVASK